MFQEKALKKALSHAFKNPLYFLCLRHLRDNVSRHVQEQTTDKKALGSILERLFGVGGIQSIRDESEFETRWYEFEVKHKDHFTKEYLQSVEERFKDHVVLPAIVMEKCGTAWSPFNNNR